MFRTSHAGMQVSGACSITAEQEEEEAHHPLPHHGGGPAGGGGVISLPRCYNPIAHAKQRRQARLEEEGRRRASGDVTSNKTLP